MVALSFWKTLIQVNQLVGNLQSVTVEITCGVPSLDGSDFNNEIGSSSNNDWLQFIYLVVEIFVLKSTLHENTERCSTM